MPRVGDLFAYRNENVTKSELVIFIRPIVVSNPSLDSEELKHLRGCCRKSTRRAESMSLLLQALQKAARSRETGTDEGPAARPPEPVAGTVLRLRPRRPPSRTSRAERGADARG